MTVFARRHLDALAELMNMGSGRAGSACAEMLEVRALLQPPKVDYWKPDTARASLERALGADLPQVMMRFEGVVEGFACLVFTPDMARTVVARAMGEDDVDGETRIATLEEVGNVVLNAVMGTLSNVAGADLVYRVPRFFSRAADNPMFTSGKSLAFGRARMMLDADKQRLPGQMILVVACDVPPVFLTALDMFFADDPDQQFLLPGDMVTSDRPAVWSTILGSCVSVCIRHRDCAVAGMNHYMLATSNGQSEIGRYGDTSIRRMWQELSVWDADPANYVARIYGGAQMFETETFEIGERNIATAYSVLQELGISIVEEKVGGRAGVHLRYETAPGKVECRVRGALV